MRRYQELLFFISIIALLAVLSYVYPTEGVTLGGHTFRFPSISQVISPSSRSGLNIEDLLAGRENSMKMPALPDSVIEARKKMLAAADSLAIADSLATADSIAFFETFFTENQSRFILPGDSIKFMTDLVSSIRTASAKGVVHIAHYGDSQIEGDRITSNIRLGLQEKYGGSGPGLVPAVQVIPSIGVTQTVSDSIARYIVDGNLIQKCPHPRYGALAQVAEVNGECYITVKSVLPKKASFSRVKLYFSSSSESFSATLVLSKDKQLEEFGEANKKYQIIEWNVPNGTTQFKVKLSGKAEIYGIEMDNGNGVSVSNIGLRGSSGTFFTKIDSKSFSYIHKDLDTRLVLMEFGGNAAPYMKDAKRTNNYYESLSAQIKYVKNCCPKAKIIVIGPADMSESVDGELQTHRYLEATIDAVKKAALDNGAAYWDMYNVMGGKNSMLDWVSNKPQLAASDYIHFTRKGAERIAKLFVESFSIYDDYEVFCRTREKRESEKRKARRKKLDEIRNSIPVDKEFADSILSVGKDNTLK